MVKGRLTRVIIPGTPSPVGEIEEMQAKDEEADQCHRVNSHDAAAESVNDTVY
jgi:hypothetical protein